MCCAMISGCLYDQSFTIKPFQYLDVYFIIHLLLKITWLTFFYFMRIN